MNKPKHLIDKPWAFKTVSGRVVDLLNFQESDVDIEDIAHHLSMTNRFGGACRRAYNNAQHSVLAMKISEVWAEKILGWTYSDLVIMTLLHDAAEAYVGDMTGPMKAVLRRVSQVHTGVPQSAFDRVHDEIHNTIVEALGLDLSALGSGMLHVVKKCDEVALIIEGAVLFPETGMTWDKISDLILRLMSSYTYKNAFVAGCKPFYDMVADVWDQPRACANFLEEFERLNVRTYNPPSKETEPC